MPNSPRPGHATRSIGLFDPANLGNGPVASRRTRTPKGNQGTKGDEDEEGDARNGTRTSDGRNGRDRSDVTGDTGRIGVTTTRGAGGEIAAPDIPGLCATFEAPGGITYGLYAMSDQAWRRRPLDRRPEGYRSAWVAGRKVWLMMAEIAPPKDG